MIERLIAYEPIFDRESYLMLSGASPERKRQHNLYTRRQVETHLGERFNILLSTTRYEIKDGQIYGENTNEPFLDMIRRGVEYRRKHGNTIDNQREQAEFDGFSFVQEEFTSGDAQPGDMLLSVSPPGGSYEHNFYDVFTLKKEEGYRFIEARRYSSGLSSEETVQKLEEAGLVGQDYLSTPEYFLSHPIPIKQSEATLINADKVHEYLHREHNYVLEEEFLEVLRFCTPLITSYINTLSEMPIDTRMQLLTLNAVFNKADMVFIHKRKGSLQPYLDSGMFLTQKEEILNLGLQPVRQVQTGCGSSGGFSVNSLSSSINSPFSVSEFSAKEWFRCPKCSYKADGPIGDTCPGCGLTKEAYIEESGAEVCA